MKRLASSTFLVSVALLLLAGCASTGAPPKAVPFHSSALNQDQLAMAQMFREREKAKAPTDWSPLIDALPCNFRGNDQPRMKVLANDLLDILGPPDEQIKLPDGSTAMDFILGYTFLGGDRQETRLSVMLAPDQSCRCVITSRLDRTR